MFLQWYMFRVSQQGPHARRSQELHVDGKMSAGFAFVAYPGVPLRCDDFYCRQSGAIYEKDLGPEPQACTSDDVYDQIPLDKAE